MVILKINGRDFFIKTSFSELTPEEVRRLQSRNMRDHLRVLSNVREELPAENLLSIEPLIEWVNDPVIIEATALDPDDFDLGGMEYYRFYHAREVLSSDASDIYKIFKVGEIYSVAGASVRKIIGNGLEALRQLEVFLTRFENATLQEEPDEAEQEAGIEALHSFGVYGILESIAEKYSVKPYAVLNWTAEEVMLELTYRSVKGRYMEKLQSIKTRQNGELSKHR
jgi:hypothetical protein